MIFLVNIINKNTVVSNLYVYSDDLVNNLDSEINGIKLALKSNIQLKVEHTLGQVQILLYDNISEIIITASYTTIVSWKLDITNNIYAIKKLD